jgi:hypothetical protein
MKKRYGIVILTLALGVQSLWAEPVISGYLDSTASMGAGAGDAGAFTYGLEEYANIRLQAKVRDMAAFYGSFNVIAASGTYARSGAAILLAGDNYSAALELERLYVKIAGEKLDAQAGLMRIAFGYGLVFGPTDFLNPRNPLLPDARPRALLGGDLAFFPRDNVKLQGFTAAPRNPLSPDGKGTLAGFAGEYHGDRMSAQGLYAFESSSDGLHRFGLSLKGDLTVGLAADMLYTYDPHAQTREDGLAATVGIDYSFLDGKLYALGEYLYSGDTASTSRFSQATGFIRKHYLFVQGLYQYSDYTNFTLGCMAGLEDLSFTPVLGAEHELFQGFTLALSVQIPLDKSFFGGEAGEFGPIPPGQQGFHAGTYFNSTIKARLRF